MKTGLALAAPNHPLIHCTDIRHGDCAFLIIVCPSCKEPVFKVEGDDREYLSHYQGGGRMDCELRVRQIVRERQAESGGSITGGLARNLISDADLEVHLARIETILLDGLIQPFNDGRYPPGVPYKHTRSYWSATIERMRKRPLFCAMIAGDRRIMRWQFAQIVSNNPNHVDVKHYDYISQYLTSPKSITALIFMACWGCIAHSDNHYPDTPSVDYDKFVNLDERKLRKWLQKEVGRGTLIGRPIYKKNYRKLCMLEFDRSLLFCILATPSFVSYEKFFITYSPDEQRKYCS